MTDQQKYRTMLKDLGWKTKDVADITGHNYGSLRASTSPRGNFPKHFLLALAVWEKMKQGKNSLKQLPE